MTQESTTNSRTKDLLGHVRSDISQLRSDISTLLSHTSRHTLPQGARDLRARERLHAGGDFAISQLRHLRNHPARSSVGILGGLILLGAAGTGIYYLCKGQLPPCCRNSGSTGNDVHPTSNNP